MRCGLRALELATGEYALDEHNAVPVIRRELLVRERDAAAERGPQRHGGTSARDDEEETHRQIRARTPVKSTEPEGCWQPGRFAGDA